MKKGVATVVLYTGKILYRNLFLLYVVAYFDELGSSVVFVLCLFLSYETFEKNMFKQKSSSQYN